ncbi:tetratricopeptide repeat protein [Tateyamaria sp. syn59]|uniref:tetratricopeptide repeat protein n=1 Tax=Tateyamaria sp. syn59 TaxID=2576942 RepID=UPI001678E750|nr:tetratricopeptide repeat protein [Tateyamaria sp. syn59]
MELIDAGDPDRAVIELRNVFALVPNHIEARETLAALMLEQNDEAAAYGHYLRLVEQVPDHWTGRTILAEIAFEARNWEEFVRHGKEAVALAPDHPRSQIIDLALQYQKTIEDRDGPARDALRDRATLLAADTPDSGVLQQVLFDAHMRDRRFDKALEQLNHVIARQPDNPSLYRKRLDLLTQLQDFAAVEAGLKEMIARFVDDERPKEDLIRFYLARDEVNKAEAFFRDIADPTDPNPRFFLGLVQFLAEIRGKEAARAELMAAVDVAPEPEQLRMRLAIMDFEAGAQDKAVADLRGLLNGDAPGTAQNAIRVTLAQMLVALGDVAGAQALVDDVLAADEMDVEALKMRAEWQIAADETDSAIAILRLVLDHAPGDIRAMHLMSDAYARAGNHSLSRDFMALAVDASDNAPDPSLRYARVLAADERYLAAEEVVIAALRRDRRNADILVLLGEIYLASEDYSRADQVIARLRTIGTDRTLTVANALEARLLGNREGVERALGFLEELAAREDAGVTTQITLLRARLSSGQTARALQQAEALVTENPDNPSLKFILAASHAASGAPGVAEMVLADLLEEDPNRMRVWAQLYRMQRVQGKSAEATQTLLDGLAIDPDNRALLWAQAVEFERAGDIEGAIANYERLYDADSGDLIAANNLGSLLANYRDDDASIERAWTVARRLRETAEPTFQDTYGYVAFRRGEFEEALSYLEPAAAALRDDPIVQFHLGRVYGALDQREQAIAQYNRVLEMAGENDTRPEFQTARSEIARIQNLPVSVEN